MDTWGKTWRCLPGSCGRWTTSPGRGPVRPAGWFLEGGGHHHSPFQRNQLHILDQRRMIWTPVRFRRFHLRWDTSRCQFYLRSYIVQLTRKSCLAGFWREGRHCFLSSGDERKRMEVKCAMVNMSLVWCLPYNCHAVSIGEGLSPEQVGYDGGQDEVGHEEAEHAVAVLEHNHGVRLKVPHVDRLLATRWCDLHWLKFGQQVATLVLMANLANMWVHLYCISRGILIRIF